MRVSRILAPLAVLVSPLMMAAEPGSTEMSLTTPDGFVIKGTLTLPARDASSGLPSGRRTHRVPVVILAHQFGSNRAGWSPLVDKLHALGIGTLALDLRGHGESTSKGGETVKVSDDFAASSKAVGFDKIPSDLAQAADWLRKQPSVDKRRIGLAGASVGAASVLVASRKIRPLAVLSLSPGDSVFSKEQMRSSLSRSGASVLIMASNSDGNAPKVAESLSDVIGVHANFKDGNQHGFDYFKDRTDTMVAYFREYLTYRQAFNRPGGTVNTSTPGKQISEEAVAAAKAAAESRKAGLESRPPMEQPKAPEAPKPAEKIDKPAEKKN
jgi:dienelactone hydrolase